MSAMDTDFAEEEVVENPTLKAAFNLAPLHHNQPLDWDYEVDLIGEKIYDKVIHLCEICELPILVYGRMLPCKHVFCFDCARKCEKTCKRCGVRVQKVEKSALGTVYVCTHGAPKHSTKGCRRTYLSQRDLQSHIAHRHLPKPPNEVKSTADSAVAQPIAPQLPLTQQQAALQQAAQAASQSTAVSVPSLSVQPPAPSVLPNMASLTPPQASQPPRPGALNPSVIPGLGDLQQGTTTGQASPTLPRDLNPNPMGLGMNFNLQSQLASDHGIYISQGMGPNSQHHHQQQQQQQQQMQQQNLMGLSSNSMPGLPKPKTMQRYGDSPSQLPVSGALMPSLNPQQMSGLGRASPSMHMTAQMHHQQQLLQEQQQLLQEQHQQQRLREQHQQQMLQEHQQQQRMNLQHHESISKMPSAMLSSTHPRPQAQSNLDNFASSPGSFEPLQTGQGRTNVNLITVPIHDEAHYPPMSMVGQSQGNALPFPPLRSNMSSQNFSPPDVSPGMNPKTNFAHIGNKANQSPNLGGGLSSSQSMPFPQSPGNMRMNNPMRMNPGTGLNMPPSALVEMFQALARPKGGTGLMPLPGTANPGPGQGRLNPRFNPANWTSGNPRSMQPRMPQNQQRPRGDGQFKHNYFG